jgi:hypothetical protein
MGDTGLIKGSTDPQDRLSPREKLNQVAANWNKNIATMFEGSQTTGLAPGDLTINIKNGNISDQESRRLSEVSKELQRNQFNLGDVRDGLSFYSDQVKYMLDSILKADAAQDKLQGGAYVDKESHNYLNNIESNLNLLRNGIYDFYAGC